ncbi:hypothetical protein [Rubritalea marina]|uniref:hypothetical protein n=1 Tax=Rubritalea marina TaxID=361055 RepID=UPI00036BA54F|nr:hypothetical protein [Rubritalea marina]
MGMLRIWFIGGYTVMLLMVIAAMGIKVISVLGPGGLGDATKVWADYLFEPTRMGAILGCIGVVGLLWIAALFKIAKGVDEWERQWVKTLIIGCVVMSGFFVVLCVVGASVFFLDGFAGEVAAKIAGYMTSPVLMELSFFFIGVFLLMVFQIGRRLYEGDEYVEIEVPDEDGQ